MCTELPTKEHRPRAERPVRMPDWVVVKTLMVKFDRGRIGGIQDMRQRVKEMEAGYGGCCLSVHCLPGYPISACAALTLAGACTCSTSPAPAAVQFTAVLYV